MSQINNDINKILDKIGNLEKRIAFLEKMLSVDPNRRKPNSTPITADDGEKTSSAATESMLPLLGIYTFFFALILSVIQPWNSPADYAMILGPILIGLTLLIFYGKILTSIPNSSVHLRIVAYITIYFGVIKSGYFTDAPLLGHFIVFIILVIVLSFFIYLERNTGAGISRGTVLVLMALSGLFAEYGWLRLALSLIVLLLAHTWEKQRERQYLLPIAFIAVMVMQLLSIDLPEKKIIYVFSLDYGRIFVPVLIMYSIFGFLSAKKGSKDGNSVVFYTILNLLFSFPIVLFLSVRVLHPELYKIQFIFFILSLILASWHWLRAHGKYSTFLYAGTGYTAMTISILTFFTFPDSLLWLCLQSLLVIITALWFRSKLLVLANFFIFILLFILSVVAGGENGYIHGTFGITALLSARILNWQKQRLTLQTEMMRNAYLISAFIILPVALYYIFPMSLYALTLNGLALIYFILRIMLQIKKYFFMSLGTLLMGIGFLLFFGFRQLEPVYLIVSLFTLGISVVAVTLYKPRSEMEKST